jgi:hypothetical protein
LEVRSFIRVLSFEAARYFIAGGSFTAAAFALSAGPSTMDDSAGFISGAGDFKRNGRQSLS